MTARLAAVPAAVIAVMVLGAGCSGVSPAQAEAEGTAPLSAATVDWAPPSEGLHSSYIATARSSTLTILNSPLGEVVEVLGGDQAAPLVALTEPPGSTGHVEVRIPGRPNGRTGWVAVDDVDITWTNYRVRIDLSARTLTLYDSGEVVFESTVAIGTEAHPTPTGRTYLAETLVNPDAGGLYGPYALGLALWSETLTEYAGGDGQVAIHGTDRPDLLGREVSHGCIRVHNDVIRELAGRLPLGTPVDIVE